MIGRRRSRFRVAALLLGMAGLASAACRRQVELTLQPPGEAGGTYFRNIGGDPYSEKFVRDFRYAGARASATFSTQNLGRLEVAIRAGGLKPNFCYQVKLEGKPGRLWSAGANDRANNLLGYAGRWWRLEPEAGPASDEEVRARGRNELYVYAGYLFFDFLVTDAKGSASVVLRVENVYDRVQREARRGRGPQDGPLRTFQVDGSTVALYGERAPGRARPGSAVLPAGRYDTQISLTEETFGEAPHARVMAGDGVRFRLWF